MGPPEAHRKLLKERLVQEIDEAIPPRFANARLSDFDDEPSSGAAKIVQKWVSRYEGKNFWELDIDLSTGLLIHGEFGVGKSHLAAAALREFAHLMLPQRSRETNSARWVHAPSFWQDIKSSWKHESGDIQYWRFAKTANPLVLDEVGEQMTTSWRVEVISSLVSSLYDDCKALIITTHLSPSNLMKMLPPSTASRLSQMLYPVRVNGPDRRQKWSP